MRLLLPLMILLGPAVVPTPVPLLNAEFTVPFDPDWAVPVVTEPRRTVTDLVLENVGGTLPAQTETGADRPAAAWTFRALSMGSVRPESEAAWVPSGYVAIRVDADDSGPATPTLSQAVGQRNHLGVWRAPDAAMVYVEAVEGANVTLGAIYTTVEEPRFPRFTEMKVLAPGGRIPVTLDFPPDEGTLGTFHLAFRAPDGDARIVLDRVHLVDSAS